MFPCLNLLSLQLTHIVQKTSIRSMISLNAIPQIMFSRSSPGNTLSVSATEHSLVVLFLSIYGYRPKLYIVAREFLVAMIMLWKIWPNSAHISDMAIILNYISLISGR